MGVSSSSEIKRVPGVLVYALVGQRKGKRFSGVFLDESEVR